MGSSEPDLVPETGDGRDAAPVGAAGDASVAGDVSAARDAAQLRYELARLRDRRTVRAALAVTGLRRTGLRGAVDVLRGELPRIDMPGPSNAPRHGPFPQLRIAVIGGATLVDGAVAWEALDPTTAAPLLARDRPDLLLVDDVTGWSPAGLAAAVAHARRSGAAVLTAGRAAGAIAADLHIDLPAGPAAVPRATRHLRLPGAVDVTRWSPVGLDDTGEPEVRTDPSRLTPVDARQQPVVVVADPSTCGINRCLELLSAGALVVAPAVPALAEALAGLAPGDREALLAPVPPPTQQPTGDPAAERAGAQGGLHERIRALLADDDRRRRLSVRVRRHVHRDLSTHAAVTTIVAALDHLPPPSSTISVLLATRRPERLGQVLADLDAQRHGDVEVVVLLHGDHDVADRLLARPRVATVERVAADRPLGAVLDRGLDLAGGTAVAKVDDDDRYGPDHLGDLLLSLRVSGADVVGRRVHGVFLEDGAVTLHPSLGGEERFEDHLPGATLLVRGGMLRTVRWRHVPNGVDTELIRAVHLAGGSAYTGHRYGFVRGRHGDHTYDPGSWPGRAAPGFDDHLLEA